MGIDLAINSEVGLCTDKIQFTKQLRAVGRLYDPAVLKEVGGAEAIPGRRLSSLLFRGEHAFYLLTGMSHTASPLQPGRALDSRSIPLPVEPSDNRRMGPGRLIVVSSSSVAPEAADR